MNPVINEVLNCINEPIVCEVDGQKKEYVNGATAIEGMANVITTSHSITNISVQDGKICLTIIDRQAEIDKQNKKWMTEQKERTGVEPSFF